MYREIRVRASRVTSQSQQGTVEEQDTLQGPLTLRQNVNVWVKGAQVQAKAHCRSGTSVAREMHRGGLGAAMSIASGIHLFIGYLPLSHRAAEDLVEGNHTRRALPAQHAVYYVFGRLLASAGERGDNVLTWCAAFILL